MLGYDTGEERDWEQITHDFILGGFMGGVFESPEIISSETMRYLGDTAAGKQLMLNDNLPSLIFEARRDTKSPNFKKATKIENSNNPSPEKVGALLRHLADEGKISASQAETLVSTGLNGAPLNEDAQVYFYAGASGVSFMDAAKLGDDLSIDGETAYAAWKKGTEIRAENDKARFKPEASLANPTLAEKVQNTKGKVENGYSEFLDETLGESETKGKKLQYSDVLEDVRRKGASNIGSIYSGVLSKLSDAKVLKKLLSMSKAERAFAKAGASGYDITAAVK